jgi:uncharacterized membrane protein YbhN (UPF0104 family)
VSRERIRLLVLALLALAVTVAIVALIGQAARYAHLIKLLKGADYRWLAVCAVGEVVAYGGFIFAYQAIAQARGGPQLTIGVVARVVGLSFGAFSVATAIGGLSVDFWALHEAGESTRNASARIIALETLRWAVLALATSMAGILALLGVGPRFSWIVCAAWVAVTSFCFATGLWISAPARADRFITVTGGPVRTALAVAVAALVLIRRVITTPGQVRLRAVGGGALFWLGELVCAYAAIRAFGASVAPLPLLLGYTTGYVANGLPLPVGGAGSVDAALTGGFVLAGVPLSAALLGAVAFRVFSFWLPALIAAFSVATMHGLRSRLRQVARTRGAERRPADGVTEPPVAEPGRPGSAPARDGVDR